MQNIAWRNWAESAFEEAANTGKPVLLSISAAWCHWCHVMDQKTYSDRRVIDTINRDFIPVRVDTDREPDINTRYNMGGWPSTVFLTADRDVLTGATYMPTDQMLIVLERVSSAYGEQIEELKDKAKEARVNTEQAFKSAGFGNSKPGDVQKSLDMLRSSYDTQYGGFGSSQKFPHTSALELLLYSYESTGNQNDLKMVVETLDAMIGGELFDSVEGGLFRYTTHRDWTAPHFEKLLMDNARMAMVLLDAYRITENMDYADTARRIFYYAEKSLMDADMGLFHGSQDAGEDYYRADATERASLTPPRVDPAFYTDSNAAMARAYLKLYGIGREIKARDRALRIVAHLNRLPRQECGCVCHYVENGEPHTFGILSDAAELVMANVVCSEATGDDTYILATKELLESIFDAFGSETGAFFDVSEVRAQRRGLTRYSTPLEENTTLVMAFVKLADLTEDEAYRLSARRVLDALAPQYENYGVMGASYALAVGVVNSMPMLVTIHAEPGTEEADAFVQASLGACGMNCTVRTVPTEAEEAVASVCLGAVCRIRVSDPEELAQALGEVATESMAESAMMP